MEASSRKQRPAQRRRRTHCGAPVLGIAIYNLQRLQEDQFACAWVACDCLISSMIKSFLTKLFMKKAARIQRRIHKAALLVKIIGHC